MVGFYIAFLVIVFSLLVILGVGEESRGRDNEILRYTQDDKLVGFHPG